MKREGGLYALFIQLRTQNQGVTLMLVFLEERYVNRKRRDSSRDTRGPAILRSGLMTYHRHHTHASTRNLAQPFRVRVHILCFSAGVSESKVQCQCLVISQASLVRYQSGMQNAHGTAPHLALGILESVRQCRPMTHRG